jgi:uncharacterized membrane protein
MPNRALNRTRVGFLLVAGLICLTSLAVYAADMNFSGKWKGESVPAAAPAAGAAAAAPPPGGGGRGGGARGGGGRGGGFGGPQKVTLNLNHNVKDSKISGNIVVGETVFDVKEGKVEGNKITFKAVMTSQPTVEYTAVMLKEGELTLTSKPTGERGRATEYILKK